MNPFPQCLFKGGGAEVIDGRRFTSMLVRDEAELEGALADGWHTSADAAAEAHDVAAAEAAAQAASEAQAHEAQVAAEVEGLIQQATDPIKAALAAAQAETGSVKAELDAEREAHAGTKAALAAAQAELEKATAGKKKT